MSSTLIPLKEVKGLYRDPFSKGIINKDINRRDDYKTRKSIVSENETLKQQIAVISNDVQRLIDEMSQLKSKYISKEVY